MKIEKREEGNLNLTDDHILWDRQTTQVVIGMKSSAALYRLMKSKKFPQPVKIGNKSRWIKSEVLKWLDEQKKKRS